jgi:hypothetical protein
MLLEHDHDVGAVVVGFDRNINYYKIQMATLCIRENPGCLFIATNTGGCAHVCARECTCVASGFGRRQKAALGCCVFL